MICELTRVVADKWGFLAASYCDHTLTERDFNWQVRDLGYVRSISSVCLVGSRGKANGGFEAAP